MLYYFFSSSDASTYERDRKETSNAGYLDIMKEPRFVLFCCVQCLTTLVLYIPLDFLPSAMVKEHHMTDQMGGGIIAYYGISSMFGRLFAGIFTQYFKNTSILCTGICMIIICGSCIGMAYSIAYWQFMVLCSIYGFYTGAIFVLLPLALVDILSTELLNLSYGIIQFFNGMSVLVGPPAFGWIKMLSGTYELVFVISGIVYFVGGLVAFIVHLIHRNNIQKSSYLEAK